MSEHRLNPESSVSAEPPGHAPIEFRDGKFYMPELLNPAGHEVKPQFLVGPEEWQQKLFIEYERSFGRGRAFDATHISGSREVRAEYQELIRCVSFMQNGTEAECKQLIDELRAFRLRHPELYTDTFDPKQPRKKFEIQE